MYLLLPNKLETLSWRVSSLNHIIKMSENKSKYDTIRQHLQSLSINSEQFHDKLTYINQTRTKITNELANLTKDYDRKIK